MELLPRDDAKAAAAFESMVTVLHHSRCMNCHSRGDFPPTKRAAQSAVVSFALPSHCRAGNAGCLSGQGREGEPDGIGFAKFQPSFSTSWLGPLRVSPAIRVVPFCTFVPTRRKEDSRQVIER